MRAIDKKLLRDLAAMKGQALAIAAVLASGVAVLVMSLTTLSSLSEARASYYASNRFADLFAPLVRAPVAVAERAAEIDGVAAVDHRVLEAINVDLPGVAEPVSGLVVSLPERPGHGLNRVHLVSGRLPEPDREGEVLVNEAFANANRVRVGDTLGATLHGHRQQLRVVGIALSPEFLIQVPPGTPFPDDRRFGVFWMARRQMEAAADMEGAFNNLALALTAGASSAAVRDAVDRLLVPYGGAGAYTRETQYSARFIDDEIRGLRRIGSVPPAIFLGVAAFLLNISLRRILTMQREQVAALKAFGYRNREVGWHYTKLVTVIIVFGTIGGCLLGTYMGERLTGMYCSFYHFPLAVFSPPSWVYVLAGVIAIVSGGVGVFGGVRATVRLPPAEAMRPEPPANYRRSWAERLGLSQLLSQPARMVVREIERRPVKAALTSLGIALACSALIVGNFGKDSIDYLMNFQFEIAERDDARVQFVEARPARVLHELEGIPGVIRAEPYRAVAVRLRHGPRARQLAITGIPSDARLLRLLDSDEQVIPVRGGGLVVSTTLAKILGVSVGDTLTLEVLEGERTAREAEVSGMVADFSGTAAYMELGALNRLLRESATVSGAYLHIDAASEEAVFAALEERPGVAGVSLKKAMIRGFMDTFAENLLRMRISNLIFACVTAVGVVYSSARIAFSERGRDLATLRVMGMTRGEVSAILLGELAVLTVVALPFGCAIGYGWCYLLSGLMETELYRIPLVVQPATFAYACLAILFTAAASGLIVRRKVDHLNMVIALKIKE